MELLAPLATYTPWSLREPGRGHPEELVDFFGTYIPFPRADAERARAGDPRRSIAERYASRAGYLEIVRREARTLAQAGLLLPDDLPRVLERAERQWDWIMGR